MFNYEIRSAQTKHIFFKKTVAVLIILMEIFSFYGCKGLIDNGENKVPLDTSQMIESEKESVQNGYLGTYKAVTVGEVLDSYYPDGKWTVFYGALDADMTADIVQFLGIRKNEETTMIQFRLIDENSFEIVHYRLNGSVYTDGEELKKNVDQLYGAYLSTHAGNGIKPDYSPSNDLLHGIRE